MKNGHRSECKICCGKMRKQQHYKNKEKNNLKSLQYYYKHKDEIVSQKKQRYSENPEKYKQLSKQRHLLNKEKDNQNARQYYKENIKEATQRNKQFCLKNPKYAKQHSKQWREKNPEKLKHYKFEKRREFNEYARNRRKTDSSFRIITCLRSRMNCALKSQGVKKSLHTIEGLGCTKEFYQNYIQSLFKPGMTLANDGKRKWQQHHPIELASVDLRNVEQQKKVFHYTNVVPIWEDEHRRLHATNHIGKNQITLFTGESNLSSAIQTPTCGSMPSIRTPQHPLLQ